MYRKRGGERREETMSVGRLLTPTPGEGGPPLETAALALPAVFLAGPTLPWRAEVQARLLLKYRTVVNPENETYLRLTEEGLKRQVAWEERMCFYPTFCVLSSKIKQSTKALSKHTKNIFKPPPFVFTRPFNTK